VDRREGLRSGATQHEGRHGRAVELVATGALARDAAAMLATTPETLEAWTRRWLDPRTGEPGWAWSIAGLDEDGRRRVGRIVALAPA
jgi:hypothetical protein